jgi:transcriptional regulator with XRE-family HTH domain
MGVLIGKEIKRVMDEKGLSVSDIAARLAVHPGSLSRIFNYKHMHTALLQKFSQALSHDFFKYFSQEIRIEKPESDKQTDLLRKEIEQLKKENGYLRQINELLTKNNPPPSPLVSRETK